MKTLKKLFILSFKNLKCRKWLNIKIAAALTFLILFVSLFSVVGISISNMRSTLFKQTVSSNYLYPLNSGSVDVPMPEGTQIIEYKRANRSPRLNENSTFDFNTVTLQIEVGEEIFISGARYPFYNSPYNVDMVACQNPFTDNDYKALKANFGLNNFIIGKMPEAADEVVVSATLLGYYNLSYEDVLGKQITFHYLDYGKLWEPFTVTGIIIPEYTELFGHVPTTGFFNACFRPEVIVADSAEAVGDDPYYVYSFPRWLTDEEIDNLSDMDEYGSSVRYIGAGIFQQAEDLAQIQTVTTNLFIILGVSFGVGILLIVYLLTERFTRYFVRGGGVLLTEGIGGRELNALTIVQISLLCGVAVLASLVLTIAIYAVVSVYLNAQVFVGWAKLMPLNGMFFCIVFGVGLAMILAVTLFLFFNIFIMTKRKSIKELLNTTAD